MYAPDAEADPAEVAACTHWLLHRIAARGLTPYPESALVEDEWAVWGGVPPEAEAAVDRGQADLTPWCPVLSARRR